MALKMAAPIIELSSEPELLKPNRTNEVSLTVKVGPGENTGIYWCECGIEVEGPMSLAPDRNTNYGIVRMGILSQGKEITQRINIYTRYVSIAGKYQVKITLYLYGESGIISERVDQVFNMVFA